MTPLTRSWDFHEYTYGTVNVYSSVFSPLPSYQVTLQYNDNNYFPDSLSLRIYGSFRETTIQCGEINETWLPACGAFVYHRHEYNAITNMWESQLDLMRTLQNTPVLFITSAETQPPTYGGSRITVEETPEPSAWLMVASATLALRLRRRQ